MKTMYSVVLFIYKVQAYKAYGERDGCGAQPTNSPNQPKTKQTKIKLKLIMQL